jgi:phosphatidate cytidylyltransferase
MALNIATFKTRALTALIFVAVMAVGLLWNQWSFLLLFTIIHFGCWWEYIKLVGLIDKDYQNISPFHKYGIMLLGFGVMLCFTSNAYTVLDIRLKDVGMFMALGMMPIIIYAEIILVKPINFKQLAHSLFGLIYISLSCGLMMSLFVNGVAVEPDRMGEFINVNARVINIILLPLAIILFIWANDTFAYLVGSFIGKTPFSKISPKKTWEGTIGGAVLCVALGGFVVSKIALFFLPDGYKLLMPAIHWYIIALIVAITGTAGDLLESKLKRLAGVKDSGSLMPGHGGFLDRFDSLLVATPFVWLYVYFFIR